MASSEIPSLVNTQWMRQPRRLNSVGSMPADSAAFVLIPPDLAMARSAQGADSEAFCMATKRPERRQG